MKVKTGVMHHILGNGMLGFALSVGVFSIPLQAIAESVYYIDDTNGNDTHSDLEAQDPATPWKTIGRGIQAAVAGDTVIVQPGDYYESVESIRDGVPDAPIIIQAGHFSAL